MRAGAVTVAGSMAITGSATPAIRIIWVFSGKRSISIAGTSLTVGASTGVLVDHAGNVFVSDVFVGRVYRIDAMTGLVTAVAGRARSVNAAHLGDDAG